MLEKHFFVEEKTIFVVSNKIRSEEDTNIFDLMQEHGNLLELVKEVEVIIITSNKLKVYLKKHSSFEGDIFYPKLNDILNDLSKKK